MKIDVCQIKEEGVLVKQCIPAEDWDLDRFDVKFVDEICFECNFKRVDRGRRQCHSLCIKDRTG